LSQGDSESGITVHLVNEEYDKGEILAQFSCAVDPTMLVDDLAKKIQDLEHTYYKTTIEKFILNV
jgi:phosphoribosylglycinamide formyltransferase-1